MKKTKFKINPYTKFSLVTPVVGLVEKIASPRGIRKQEESGRYTYKFTSEEFWVYNDKSLELEPGIYKILDICQQSTGSHWNNYLFIIDDDGSMYPIAEYLNCPDTLWVKNALPLVKKYFAGEEIDSIKLTDLTSKKQKKSGWLRVKK